MDGYYATIAIDWKDALTLGECRYNRIFWPLTSETRSWRGRRFLTTNLAHLLAKKCRQAIDDLNAEYMKDLYGVLP